MSKTYSSSSVTFRKRFLSMLDRALFLEDTKNIGICDYLRAFENTSVQRHGLRGHWYDPRSAVNH